VAAHRDSAADIIVAHLSASDPALASKLADALDS
jgi:hypothetical protein